MNKSTAPTDKKPANKQKLEPLPEVTLEDCTPFEAELRKKLRNRNKKLERIIELKMKVKKEGLEPNEEQAEKIKSEASVKEEIKEVHLLILDYHKT